MAFADLLRGRQPALLVSLPRNDAELARAALDAGADALKVHIGVKHRASGTHFGTLAEETPRLEAILAAAAGRPVGIVAGETPHLPATLAEQLTRMGFAFISLYADHLPAAWLGRGDIALVPSLRPDTPVREAARLPALGAAAVELGIIPPEGYGQPLTAADLARYSAHAEAIAAPCIVPTQRAIRPEDVPALSRAGIRGLLVGAVVTGTAAADLAAAVRRFRAAIDAGHAPGGGRGA